MGASGSIVARRSQLALIPMTVLTMRARKTWSDSATSVERSSPGRHDATRGTSASRVQAVAGETGTTTTSSSDTVVPAVFLADRKSVV